MAFEIDAQTYEDLNIFPNHKSNFSIYDLFKNCKTIYGRQKVQEMMRQPTNDLKVLSNRRDAIDHLRRENIVLDMTESQIDLILHYLNHTKGKLKANIIDALSIFLKNKIRETQDYYVVKIGLSNLLSLLHSAYALASLLAESNAPSYIKTRTGKIAALLAQLPLDRRYYASKKKTFRFYELSQLDALLRNAKHVKLLHQILDILYELDALQTIANTCDEREFTLPTYIENQIGPDLVVEGLYHPAIANAIKNNISINQNNHVTFLSGSNMAGKSSFLKSIGIAIYLTHIAFPVPASSLRTTVFNGLLSAINIADNVQNGLSHYLSEVMRVKQLLNLLIEKQKFFVILDELFKGTNAKDASEATALVVDGFTKIRNSAFIISSHINELSEGFKSKNISLMHMEHLITNGEPIFTYKFKEGVTKDGIGMYFIHHENIPNLLSAAEKAVTSSYI